MRGSYRSKEKLARVRSKLLRTGIELGAFNHLSESGSTDAAKGGGKR